MTSIQSRWLLIFHDQARHRFCHSTFHWQFPSSKFVGSSCRKHQSQQEVHQFSSLTILQDQFIHFLNVFIYSGGWRLPWTRLAFKQQAIIPKAQKPFVNLCFAQASILVSCLKHGNCSGWRFLQQKTKIHRGTWFLHPSHCKNRWTRKNCKKAPHVA